MNEFVGMKCEMLSEYVCVDKEDIGQDIDENVLTNEKCLIWQTGQSEKFAM